MRDEGSAAPSRVRRRAPGGADNAGREPGPSSRQRGERTRQRIAESVIQLIEEGDPAPTARAAAERAGVSVRLVFHHFSDMEELYRLVMTVQAERHWQPAPDVVPGAPLDERIEGTVRQRAKLFEGIAPVRRAGAIRMSLSPEIAAGIAGADRELRRRLQAAFVSELAAAGRGRRDLLEALDAAVSWEAWDRLRDRQGLSGAAARRVMAMTVRGLFGG